MSVFLSSLAIGADTLLLLQAQVLRSLYVQHLKHTTETYTAAVMNACIGMYESLSVSIKVFKQNACSGGAHATRLLATCIESSFADQDSLLDFADTNYLKCVTALYGPDTSVLVLGHEELGKRLRGRLRVAVEDFLKDRVCDVARVVHGQRQVGFGDGALAKGEGGSDEGYGTDGSHGIDEDIGWLFERVFSAMDELIAGMQLALEDALDSGHSEELLEDEVDGELSE